MQAFTAKRVDGVDYPPGLAGVGWSHGLRAPGRIVMVVQEGSCWVRHEDGSRENLTAKSVVIWDPGDWVEYGHGDNGGKVELYWSETFSEQEWAAMLAEVFGPEAAR
jgi:hypothetical protein